MNAFKLPDLGEGLQSAEIVAWHVTEGEHVVVDQPLLSVETEKAVVEIPSPQAGRIARLLVRPGERIDVGAPLLEFEVGPHADAGTVVGELELASPPLRVTSDKADARRAGQAPRDVRAAPAVRARARELGVDLAKVTPSGPDGSITMADVSSAESLDANTSLRGARRTMALNMARAWQEVAHATLHDAADIGGWSRQEDVTVRLIRALIHACKAEPRMNASFDAKALRLTPNPHIDLGIAIDGPDGLFVPVLRDAAGSKASEWRRQLEMFKAGVRDRSLTPADLRNPTITLSNFGTIAGNHASLIIVPPQVAILGAGRISEHPVKMENGVAFRSMLPLSLTFDHRAISGGDAARFLRAVIEDLQQAS